MNEFYKEIQREAEKKKADFLKKKNPEKFEYIYDEIQGINKCVAELREEEYSCDCDDNSEWIEKIKFEQREFLERIESLEYELGEIDSLKEEIKEQNNLIKSLMEKIYCLESELFQFKKETKKLKK